MYLFLFETISTNDNRSSTHNTAQLGCFRCWLIVLLFAGRESKRGPTSCLPTKVSKTGSADVWVRKKRGVHRVVDWQGGCWFASLQETGPWLRLVTLFLVVAARVFVLGLEDVTMKSWFHTLVRILCTRQYWLMYYRQQSRIESPTESYESTRDLEAISFCNHQTSGTQNSLTKHDLPRAPTDTNACALSLIFLKKNLKTNCAFRDFGDISGAQLFFFLFSLFLFWINVYSCPNENDNKVTTKQKYIYIFFFGKTL